jgi:hypothetical protein
MATEDRKADTPHTQTHTKKNTHTHTAVRQQSDATGIQRNLPVWRRGITQHWQKTEEARTDQRIQRGVEQALRAKQQSYYKPMTDNMTKDR